MPFDVRVNVSEKMQRSPLKLWKAPDVDGVEKFIDLMV